MYKCLIVYKDKPLYKNDLFYTKNTNVNIRKLCKLKVVNIRNSLLLKLV